MMNSRRAPEKGSDDHSEYGAGRQLDEQLLEALGQLKAVVEEQLAAIHDRVEHIAEVVREAVEEIGVLRDVIDEEREVIEWAAHNGKPIFQLTSFPADPAAKDWAARLNSVRPEDLSPEASAAPPQPAPEPHQAADHETPSAQKKLWS